MKCCPALCSKNPYAQDARGNVPAVAPKGNPEVIPRAQKVSRSMLPLHLLK